MDHVLGGKRRAIVKTDALSKIEDPLFALKIPRFGKHADVVQFDVIYFNQRLGHMIPDAVFGAGRECVGIERTQTDAAQDRQTLLGCGITYLRPRRGRPNTQTSKGASFEKISAIASFPVRRHTYLLCSYAFCHRLCKSEETTGLLG